MHLWLLCQESGADNCPVNYGNKVSIVLVGQEVITFANFLEAFMVMFRLYAVHLDFPTHLNHTFKFVQNILQGLDDGKL
ncbi:hypothetical protein NQD34_010310 [Periophthalmus magnuspinnatus]|uniref:Uncharacterized protein n=1 Tax=Periophthalmus magnuspinnatus TaxID=409849 RepID=A0A3B4ALB4_9GOBI|nr:hypothetical protein NQD34_010310 [Periophthalmus magnuspinnatus]